MGCVLWVQALINVLSRSLQWWMHYRVLLHCVIITPGCIGNNCSPGHGITNVFATCRKNFSQWHRSFQRKLRSHWLKFLRHVAISLVIQGPGHGIQYENHLKTRQTWQISCSLKIWGEFPLSLRVGVRGACSQQAVAVVKANARFISC